MLTNVIEPVISEVSLDATRIPGRPGFFLRRARLYSDVQYSTTVIHPLQLNFLCFGKK